MARSEGKQVILSYNHNSINVVKKIFDILKEKNILAWYDEQNVEDKISDSMHSAIDEAEIVCCFMTPKYQDSMNCQNELRYAKEKNKHIIPCMIVDEQHKRWKPTDWLEIITAGHNYIDFQEDSDLNIRSKAEELINRIRNQFSTPAQYSLTNTIKEKYLKEDKIKCTLNEEDTFLIEQSYINLAMVNANEKSTKHEVTNIRDPEEEEDYHWKHHDSRISGVYEEIYGDKKPADIEKIFQNISNPLKKVLVFGRPGAGKSTFCQYVTYRWAKGELWSQYELIVLIDLPKLASAHYPETKLYTVVDLVEREYRSFGDLSSEEKKSFQQQCDEGKVLWILDGYDELAPNVPEQLKQCLNDIRDKQNHILTSSSDDITISYDIKMEMIGFTNADIPKYVGQFFRQIEGGSRNTSSKGQKLLDYLYSNRSIWRVVHIPVNLELICRLSVGPNWLETKASTMTALYDEFVVWLCRRQLTKDNTNQEEMAKEAVYKQFNKELLFLEHLAFKMIQSGKTILSQNLLDETGIEIGCCPHEHLRVLQLGILKSYGSKSFGNQNETTKQYYFIHSSYQELFAAHHLLKILKSSGANVGTEFIKRNKYNQRFRLVFAFAAGLLAKSDYRPCTNTFWTTIQKKPIDLGGLQHFQLLTECVDERDDSYVFEDRLDPLKELWKLFNLLLNIKANVVKNNVIKVLTKTQNIPHRTLIQNNLARLLLKGDASRTVVFGLILQFPVLQPTEKLFSVLLRLLEASSSSTRAGACTALGNIDGNAVTKQLIEALVNALRDDNSNVHSVAIEVLVKLNEKVTTNLVIDGLIHALTADKNFQIRIRACKALGKIAEKTPTNAVLAALMTALGDTTSDVASSAREALMTLGEKAATNEVITGLINVLRDDAEWIRKSARDALINLGNEAETEKAIAALIEALRNTNSDIQVNACETLGKIGGKAARTEVLTVLVDALGDKTECVRRSACEALVKIGEKTATNQVIDSLIDAFRHKRDSVRQNVCKALGNIGEKAVTSNVITTLIDALDDDDLVIRATAREALVELGRKAATNEVITGLSNALHHAHIWIRDSACLILTGIGEKAATKEAITALISVLGDEDEDVQSSACTALETLGKYAVTNELIDGLAKALGSNDLHVRRNACSILSRIGDKAGTNEMITHLVNLPIDKNSCYQISACEALGNIGKKAATNEVLDSLINTLHDNRNYAASVREKACKVLGNMGEKAATEKVINGLIDAIWDHRQNQNVAKEAWEAVVRLGETAKTNQVIVCLLERFSDRIYSELDSYVSKALAGAMNSYTATKDLDANTIVKLEECLKRCVTIELGRIPRDQFIRVFLETKNSAWIPLVAYAALLQNVAVSVTDNKITIYDGKYVMEAEMSAALAKNITMINDFSLNQALSSKKKEKSCVLRSEG